MMEKYGLNIVEEAESLTDIFDIVKSLPSKLDGNASLMWFRGQGDYNYKLLPSLYRATHEVHFYDEGYSSFNLMEDMRMQHYHANNYQFINNSGYNNIEWLGMAQHHQIKTRLLDWSTSMIHSLIFAVEEYLNVEKTLERKISPKVPCLWILKPQELNKRILKEYFLNKSLIDKILSMVGNTNDAAAGTLRVLMNGIKKDLKTDKDFDKLAKVYFESPREQDAKLNYIYNLAYFDKMLQFVKNNPQAAFSANNINPFHVLLSMAYFDGQGNQFLNGTPLAVIQPYQSERIRAQRGVFTIFPHPAPKESGYSGEYHYLPLENNPMANGLLCKIIIKDPYKMAEEMKAVGVNMTWLYPEAPFVNNEIEN